MDLYLFQNIQTSTSHNKQQLVGIFGKMNKNKSSYLSLDSAPKYNVYHLFVHNFNQVKICVYKNEVNLLNEIKNRVYGYCAYFNRNLYNDKLKARKMFFYFLSIIEHFHIDNLYEKYRRQDNPHICLFFPIFNYIGVFIDKTIKHIYDLWLFSLSFRHALFRVMFS